MKSLPAFSNSREQFRCLGLDGEWNTHQYQIFPGSAHRLGALFTVRLTIRSPMVISHPTRARTLPITVTITIPGSNQQSRPWNDILEPVLFDPIPVRYFSFCHPGVTSPWSTPNRRSLSREAALRQLQRRSSSIFAACLSIPRSAAACAWVSILLASVGLSEREQQHPLPLRKKCPLSPVSRTNLLQLLLLHRENPDQSDTHRCRLSYTPIALERVDS